MPFSPMQDCDISGARQMKTKTSDSRAVWRKQKDNSSVLFLASCKKNCCPMPFLSGFMIAKIVFKLSSCRPFHSIRNRPNRKKTRRFALFRLPFSTVLSVGMRMTSLRLEEIKNVFCAKRKKVRPRLNLKNV